MSDGENVGGSEGAMPERSIPQDANHPADANTTVTGRPSEVPREATEAVESHFAQQPPSTNVAPASTLANRNAPPANPGVEVRVPSSASNPTDSTEVADVDAQATEPAPPAHIAAQRVKDMQRLSEASERAERSKQLEASAVLADPFGSTQKQRASGTSTVVPTSIVSTSLETVSLATGPLDPRTSAFNTKSPKEAVREHPELAGTYATVASIERKVTEDGLNSRQTEIVMQQVRRNVVNSIERGEVPAVQLREQRETHRDKSDVQDLSR